MLMLRVDDTYIDLYENQPVNLKYQYSDLGQIQAAVGNFSQSFRIPATDNNRAVFGQFQDPNEVGGFNPKQKVDAWLFVDTVPIMTGVVQLKKATVRNGKHTEFEIVFFGESVDLAKTLGNQKLSDLDLSSFDHNVTWDNVEGSWSGSLLSGDVRYGLVDKGYNWNQNGGNTINSSNPLYAGLFTPFLRVSSIVEEILDQNGFILDGTFTTTDWDNYYTPLFKGKNYVSDSDDQEDVLFGVGQDATQTIQGANTYTETPLTNWSDTLSNFYDPDDYFDPSTGYIRFDFSGFFTIRYWVTLTATITANPNGNEIYGMALRKVSDGTLISQTGLGYLINNGDTETAVWSEQNLLLEANTDYEMVVVHSMNIADSLEVQFANSTEPNDGGTGIRLLAASAPLFDQTADIANNCPDITQLEYLTSLGKMFNLVFIPDKLEPKKINIKVWNDYHTGGTVKDWTGKLDISKDLVIEPTVDIQKKNYEFTYSEGKDFTNEFYAESADRIYGRYLIEDGTNDFATGELKVQPKFGAYPVSAIDGTNILIHKSIKANGSIVEEPLCRVVYWGGLQNCTTLEVYDEDTASNVQITQYPYFGHYSVPNPDADDTDLNYGGEIPPHPITSNPSDNLYFTYWLDYVNQLYSDEARILTAHFKLNEVDVSGFEWSDNIWIKDSYWRILEMDYSPNSDTVTKVKLIKILAAIRACEWIPYQGNADGTITFIDSSGTQGNPSQTCCEFYGYSFNSADSKCYASGNIQAPQPNAIANQVGTAISNVNANAYSNGNDINAPAGASGFISGNRITLNDSARNSIVVGEYLDLTAPNSQVFGTNTNGFVEGLHRGGGWWYENFISASRGSAQSGQITYIFEGDFDSGDEVELFIEGKNGNRLSIPNNTALSCRMDVMITTEGVSGGVSNVEYLTFYEILEKSTAGVASAFYSSHTNNPVIQIGDFGGGNKFHLDIDTATDTSQHRLTLHNQSTSNTENTRIVCVMNYLMATL